jgi:hypothetical protein
MLELDGTRVGLISKLDGGGIKTDVLESETSRGPWRGLCKPKYEDVKFQVGMSMASGFYQWIEQFFSGKIDRRNGAIIAADERYEGRARRTLEQCLISEITIPTLDSADDRTPCHMGVTVVPTCIRFDKESSHPVSAPMDDSQRQWTVKCFTMSLDAWPSACHRVARVESFGIKQPILEYRYSSASLSSRDPVRVPGLIEYPKITFSIPEVDAAPIEEHFTRTVIEGRPQSLPRHNGEIAFTDRLGNQLCRIELRGVDVSNVAPDGFDSESTKTKLVKVEITCEGMKFRWIGGENWASFDLATSFTGSPW